MTLFGDTQYADTAGPCIVLSTYTYVEEIILCILNVGDKTNNKIVSQQNEMIC